MGEWMGIPCFMPSRRKPSEYVSRKEVVAAVVARRRLVASGWVWSHGLRRVRTGMDEVVFVVLAVGWGWVCWEGWGCGGWLGVGHVLAVCYDAVWVWHGRDGWDQVHSLQYTWNMVCSNLPLLFRVFLPPSPSPIPPSSPPTPPSRLRRRVLRQLGDLLLNRLVVQPLERDLLLLAKVCVVR